MTNATYDFDSTARANVLAADVEGLTAAIDAANLTVAEAAVLPALIAGCKGRGIRPLSVLLGAYDQPNSTQAYSPALAVSRGATI